MLKIEKDDLMDTEQLKAILIDFDGTLVNTLPVLFNAYKEGLAIISCKGSREEFEKLNGATFREILESLAVTHQLNPQQIIDFATFYKQKAHALATAEAQLFPGVEDFIQFSKSKHWELLLVTSSSKEWVMPVLKRLNVAEAFSHVISANSVARGKPFPDVYLKALEIGNISNEQALAIEDSQNGIIAAANAKLSVLSFGSHSPSTTLPGVVARCRSWTHVVEFLKKETHGSHTV